MEDVSTSQEYSLPDAGKVAYINFVPSLIPIDVDDPSYDPDEVRERCMAPMRALDEYPFTSVQREAERGDLMMEVELGIRYYTGCTVELDNEEGLRHWRTITHMENIRDRLDNDLAFREVAGKAFFCLCTHWHDQFIESGDGFDLLESAKLANTAVGLTGAISPIGLVVASQLHGALRLFDEHAGQVSAISEKDKNWMKERSAELYNLWHFWERRQVAMEMMDRLHEEKVRRAPNAYECARDGCGLRAGSQTMLKKCGGPCPPESKPHYCSKECQRMDWRVHKRDCRGRATAAPMAVVSQPLPAETTVSTDRRDRTLRMVVPRADGGYREIVSSTMSPEFMKEFRASILASHASEVD
ncbi:hypothetical protein OF83DRAFT_1126871 [Amylostereum chailletii]|nr:hypothetical protein OF83DRAFT_1126871 [Amylostereum chailletii]